jgi:hypothetical protein
MSRPARLCGAAARRPEITMTMPIQLMAQLAKPFGAGGNAAATIRNDVQIR